MASSATFRTAFKGVTKGALQWFPKHMNSGIKQMQAKLRSVDCILEVHDARIPLSGRNPTLFEQMVGPKPHILILNKCDLITEAEGKRIMAIIKTQNNRKSLDDDSIIFTNSKNDKCNGIKNLVSLMCDRIKTSDRFHRSGTREYHAMIIGIPNVGKSSLINILRARNLKKGRAVKVGPSAGVTKCVHEKVKISENPIIFLFDTPGILQPRVPNIQSGMKLAACGNLPDTQVGNFCIADYILYELNKNGLFQYTKFVGIKEPIDCIATVLSSYSKLANLVVNAKSPETHNFELKPNMEAAAVHFISAYRKGKFGKLVLDNIGCSEDAFKTYKDHMENYTTIDSQEINISDSEPQPQQQLIDRKSLSLPENRPNLIY